MQSVLLTIIRRAGMLWQIRLRHVSRDISASGLALVFVPASEFDWERPIMRPVSIALMEELFSGRKGTASLVSELDAAIESRKLKPRQTA